MPIPDFQTLMRPVLSHLQDGEIRRSRDVNEAMADHYGLTAAERAEMIPSGRARLMDNRVGWALTYLVQAGLVEHPVRGQVRITDPGTMALADYPDRIDMKVLEAFPSYRAFKARTRTVSDSPSEAAGISASSGATPQELVEAALAQNRAALESEVLNRALSLSPTGFEDLVMACLSGWAMADWGPSRGPALPGTREWTA